MSEENKIVDMLSSGLDAAAGGAVPSKADPAPATQASAETPAQPQAPEPAQQEAPPAETPAQPQAPEPLPGSEVSETLANLVQSIRGGKPAENQAQASVPRLQFDLASIEIRDGVSELEIKRAADAILEAPERKKTMQVVCCQSSYAAELSALRNQDIQSIAESRVDFYSRQKKIYQTIHAHIESTSVGKMDFVTWMKNTSFFDVETLLYGIYCQTFPYDNKYVLRCPKDECGRTFDVIVNNDTLIEMRGREPEIYEKINEVVARVKKPEELLANSLVHTTKRVVLEESQIVFEIQIPSVYDYLEGLLSRINDEKAAEYSASLTMIMFTKRALLPDWQLYRSTGRLQFVPVEAKETLLDIISKIPYFDGVQLMEEINEFTGRYRIYYTIKNVFCPHCGLEIGEVPLEMENVLFHTIGRGRSERKQ